MADDNQSTNNTDLIDVGDITTNFDEELPLPPDSGGQAVPGLERRHEGEGPAIAEVKDRLTAFGIDIAFLYVIFWLLMILYRTIAYGSAAGPIPASGMNGLIFAGIFLFVAFLWFLIPEFVFSGSVGKHMCHLAVRSNDGGHASFLSVLVRNLLRPIDIILAPVLITFALFEWTAWTQRLGDLAGRTVVIKKLSMPPRQYDVTLDSISSATRRAIAFIIVDITLFIAFIMGFALLLNPDEPLMSMLMVVLSPLVAIAFFAFPEWVTKTSPGKWLFGLNICYEDGSVQDLTGSLIRTCWRVFDCNPFGFLTCLFSLRHQRPGDGAAGTLVIKSKRTLRGFFGLLIVLLVSAGLLYTGLTNRDNFLSSEFEVNFLPSIDMRGMGKKKASELPKNLLIQDFTFAAGSPDAKRKPSIFQPGENLYLVFNVDGYTRKDGRVWLQEDLSIRYPDDTIGLKLENINDFNKEVMEYGPIRFENNIALPESAAAGRYTVLITVRDKLSRRELKEQRFFYVTPQKVSEGEEGTPRPSEPKPKPSVPGTEGATKSPPPSPFGQ